MIKNVINSLINEFIKNKIIHEKDRIYYKNIVSGYLGINNNHCDILETSDIAYLFNLIGDYAQKKLAINKDTTIDFISSILMAPPSQINQKFWEIYAKDKYKAIDFFNNYSINSYYVKYDRLRKNLEWETMTEYGNIQIMINFTKPEKSIHKIEKASNEDDKNRYPRCVLCYENIGYFGSLKINSRQNIRFIEFNLGNQEVFMHYSPYEYYKEHLIINSKVHTPILINNNTYVQMIDFIDKFPFYFIGSNADLPIVGGSILSHLHYQAGKGSFPIFNAKKITNIQLENIEIQILNWPLSTIKLISNNKQKILEYSQKVTNEWFAYENKKLEIMNYKGNKRQNSVTPIVWKNQENYEMYIILRNNGKSKKYPNGIFHIHKDIWNIKKENIGLIEAMGKAILPSRLKDEVKIIKNVMHSKKMQLPQIISYHQEWFMSLMKKWKNQDINEFLMKEIGLHFMKGLKNCGVFLNNEQEFIEFLKKVV